ncbi:ExeA family protein [Desulfocastanea catecholica]
MYLSFYGLKQKPFQSSANPSFIWLGKMHKKVLAILQYGILQNQGILVLTGDVGTGKTTLVNALINNLGNDVVVAKVPDPGLEPIDLLNYISHAFGMDKRFVCKEDFLMHFDRFLQSRAAAGKKILLIIDEAQRLNSALLEEIRLLSNIEKQQAKVLNILFVGQNLLSDFLQESQNRAISQRIAIRAALDPLSIDETAEYMRQSLRIAGAEKAIFSADAVRNVHEYSGGFLRRINIICDHAMLRGYLQGKKTVTVDMVRKCAADLCLPDAAEKLAVNPVQGIDGSEAENLQDIPPESVQETGSTQAWKTIGILIVIGVIAATYFSFPQEHRSLFSRIQKNGLQALHTLQEIDQVHVRKKAEPLPETARRDHPVTAKGATISQTTAMDMVAAEDHVDEKMASVERDLDEQRTVNGLEEPLAAIDTVDTIDQEEIPSIEEKSVVEFHPRAATNETQQKDRNAENKETVSTVYTELVESMIEKMTGHMPGVAVGPAEPEEAEEVGQGVEATPADGDPGALIDWVIKKRAE